MTTITPPGGFRTGHLPDHPEVVRRRAGLHLHPDAHVLEALAANLPFSTANRAFLSPTRGGPGILDQHDTGSCEGHAHASGGTLRLAILGQSKGLISPSMMYLCALLIDRVVNPDGTLSVVTDTGTMPSSVLTAWQIFGAILAASDPQYPASSQTLYAHPADENSPLVLPSPEKLYAASPYRFQGAYFITSSGPTRLLLALAALASGRPITDAIPASGSAFQGYSGGVVGRLSGPIDHANLIVDYTWTGAPADWSTFQAALRTGDTATMTRLAPGLVLHCVNSWSSSWGESDSVAGAPGGMYRGNTDYFDQAQDLCVVDLVAA